MMYIKREENENLGSFINRACDIKNRENEEVSLDFGDGVVLNTEDYKDSEDIISDLRYDYIIQSSKNYNDVIDENIDLDEEIEENLPDDLMEDSTDVEDMEIEESENTDLDEEIEENLPEDLENENSEIEIDSSNLNEKEEDASLIEPEKNIDGDINYNSLESLDLLTKYAEVSGEYPKLNEEEIRSINVKITELKAQYNDLLNIKKEQYNQKIAQIQFASRFQTDQMIKTNKSIDNSISYYQSLKDEYNDIMSKYDQEKLNLEEGMKEFSDKVSNSEAAGNAIDLINKYNLKDNKNYKMIDALKLVSISDQTIKDEVNKIYKLKWNVEAYDEYVSEFYKDNYIEKIDNKIKELDSQRITKDDVKHNIEEFMLEILPDSVTKEDGSISYDLETNDEELVSLKQQMTELETQISNVDNHPVSLECEIIDMMRSGASKDLITEKMNKLTSMIHQDNINEAFNSDKEELLNVDREIKEKQEFIKTKKADLDNKKYINQDLIDLDQMKLERLTDQQQKELEEIRKCDVILENKENSKKVKELNNKISYYTNLKNQSINDLNKYVALHGERKGDKQLERLKEIVKFNKNTVIDFKNSKRNLSKDIKLSEKLTPITYIEVKRQLSIEIEKDIAKDIEILTKEIENKKENNLYDDLDIKNRILNDIDNANSDIEMLESLKIALSNHSVDSLKNNVINYNIDDLNNENNLEKEDKDEVKEDFDEELEENLNEELEEIEEIEEIDKFSKAKKSLIEKIKSLPFKKIAITAITTITAAAIAISTAVVHHNNKKSEVDLKQNIEELQQQINDSNEILTNKINEISKQQEKQDSKETTNEFLDETNEVEENIVDTSKIASTAKDAANGNFIDENKLHKEYYSNEMVQSLNDFDTIDGKNIQTVVGHDGTIIGFTEAEQEDQEVAKTR